MSSLKSRKGKGKAKAVSIKQEAVEVELEPILSPEDVRCIDQVLNEVANKEVHQNVDIPLDTTILSKESKAVESPRNDSTDTSSHEEPEPTRESDGDGDVEVASVDGGGRGTIDVNGISSSSSESVESDLRTPFYFGAMVAGIGASVGASVAIWLVSKVL